MGITWKYWKQGSLVGYDVDFDDEYIKLRPLQCGQTFSI
jgi:hypothetical protein